jgi:hypothetical protein
MDLLYLDSLVFRQLEQCRYRLVRTVWPTWWWSEQALGKTLRAVVITKESGVLRMREHPADNSVNYSVKDEVLNRRCARE